MLRVVTNKPLRVVTNNPPEEGSLLKIWESYASLLFYFEFVSFIYIQAAVLPGLVIEYLVHQPAGLATCKCLFFRPPK